MTGASGCGVLVRVFSCPFPFLLLSCFRVCSFRGLFSNRNFVESFGHGLLRDSEIHCLWLWVTCLSSFLPGHAAFITPKPPFEEKKTLCPHNSPLHPSPLRDATPLFHCTPHFGGCIKPPPGLPPPYPKRRKRETTSRAHGKSLFVVRCSRARSGPGAAGVPPLFPCRGGTSQHPAAPRHRGWVSTGPPSRSGDVCVKGNLCPKLTHFFCSGDT